MVGSGLLLLNVIGWGCAGASSALTEVPAQPGLVNITTTRAATGSGGSWPQRVACEGTGNTTCGSYEAFVRFPDPDRYSIDVLYGRSWLGVCTGYPGHADAAALPKTKG
jgi:hypothetical protein